MRIIKLLALCVALSACFSERVLSPEEERAQQLAVCGGALQSGEIGQCDVNGFHYARRDDVLCVALAHFTSTTNGVKTTTHGLWVGIDGKRCPFAQELGE